MSSDNAVTGVNWFRYQHGHPRCPRAGEIFWVSWSGRQFIAIWTDAAGALAWGEFKVKSNGKPSGDPTPVRLPGEPELWRPLDEKRWNRLMGEPVTPSEAGRMVTERTRFGLVDEAEAADLSREMAGWRAEANAGANGEPPKRRTKPQIQWWRDATKITYEDAPNISKEMVEGRVMRAVYNCGTRNEWSCRAPNGLREMTAELADALRSLAESEAMLAPNTVPRMVSTPKDESDFDTAMKWFGALYPPEKRPKNWGMLDTMARFNREQRIIVWKAKNVAPSDDEIGAMTPGKRGPTVTGEYVRQVYDGAITKCWRVANGFAVDPSVRYRADVKTRNKKAKAAMRAGNWIAIPSSEGSNEGRALLSPSISPPRKRRGVRGLHDSGI